MDSRNSLSRAGRSRFADKMFDLEAVKAVITRGVEKKLVEISVVNLVRFRGPRERGGQSVAGQ